MHVNKKNSKKVQHNNTATLPDMPGSSLPRHSIDASILWYGQSEKQQRRQQGGEHGPTQHSAVKPILEALHVTT